MNTFAPYLVAVMAVACYASLSPLVKKFQIESIPDFAFISITMGFLCVFAGVISFFFEKDFSIMKLNPKVLAALAGFSLINLVAFVFYLLALSKLPATQYQLLNLASPIFAGILAYFLLGENIKPQYFYGLILMCVGLFVALRGGTN